MAILSAISRSEKQRYMDGRRARDDSAKEVHKVKIKRKRSVSQARRKRAVEMLSEGVPKASVAKQLGLSQRTLSDSLGASGSSWVSEKADCQRCQGTGGARGNDCNFCGGTGMR